jgi:hypothetical protein
MTTFVGLRMRPEANAIKMEEKTVGFPFTTMLQHTGLFWPRIFLA